jgi:hypothetical protein
MPTTPPPGSPCFTYTTCASCTDALLRAPGSDQVCYWCANGVAGQGFCKLDDGALYPCPAEFSQRVDAFASCATHAPTPAADGTPTSTSITLEPISNGNTTSSSGGISTNSGDTTANVVDSQAGESSVPWLGIAVGGGICCCLVLIGVVALIVMRRRASAAGGGGDGGGNADSDADPLYPEFASAHEPVERESIYTSSAAMLADAPKTGGICNFCDFFFFFLLVTLF